MTPIPVHYPEELDPDKYRDDSCEHFAQCLRIAAVNNWPGFSCGACELAPAGLIRPVTTCQNCGASPVIIVKSGAVFCSNKCGRAWQQRQYHDTNRDKINAARKEHRKKYKAKR